MKNNFEHTERVSDLIDAAERSARKRRIKTAAIIVSVVAVVVAIWIICYSQGFDPRGLIKSRYPWLGWS